MTTIKFTPEQQAKLAEAVAILTESDEKWHRLLRLIAQAAGEETAKKVAELEVHVRGGMISEEQALGKIKQTIEEGLRRRLIDMFFDGMVKKVERVKS